MAGKKPLQAYVAVMRKLLHGIFGMRRRGANYDSALLFTAGAAKST